MARWTATTAIPVANIRFFDVSRSIGRVVVDPEASEMIIPMRILHMGSIPHRDVVLTIGNGRSEGVRAKANPTSAHDFVEVFSTTVGVATAYTTCRAAFDSGGINGLLTAMAGLGLLPPGSVS